MSNVSEAADLPLKQNIRKFQPQVADLMCTSDRNTKVFPSLCFKKKKVSFIVDSSLY
jgi:hypothetical protein